METDEQLLSSLTDRASETLRALGYSSTTHANGTIANIVARAPDHPVGIIEIAFLERETSEVHLPIERTFGIPEYIRDAFGEAVDAMCEIVAKVDHGDYESYTERRMFRTAEVVHVEVQGVGLQGRRSKPPFAERLAEIENH